jgi:hypothetical protein
MCGLAGGSGERRGKGWNLGLGLEPRVRVRLNETTAAKLSSTSINRSKTRISSAAAFKASLIQSLRWN